MKTSLEGIANRACLDPHHKFGDLYGCLNEEFLSDSFRYLKRDKAPGIDEVSLEEYGRNLES
ncbi:MAG: group II intron reverse transcriptase/maturase, partial [bacterium]|nr:group II intron reverse transcriptase/maturase [bacterium]